MRNKILFQIWVFKFCLKVVYPKIHPYTFLIFLVIKNKLNYTSRSINAKSMNSYNLKALPMQAFELLIQDQIQNFSILCHKCLIISKKYFMELCTQNLFYVDNGVLWLTIKLEPGLKSKHKNESKSKRLRYNLDFLTSEIHKKLWTEDKAQNKDSIRIIAVVGNALVPESVAYATETELYNISKCYSIDESDLKITFHPIPQFEDSLKIASKAEVSLLVNEFELSTDFIKEVLNNHFEVPKVMSLNDVFSIDITPNITLKHHYKYLDLVESSGKLHFKCTELIGDTETDKSKAKKSAGDLIPSYYIVRGVTQLTLSESIHLIKPHEEFFAKNKCKNFCMLHLCPAGLKNKFIQMQETIYPFIHGDVNELSTSMNNPIIPMLLLTGPVGSGRHMLVKTLSKFNGLNCLQFDCNAIQSSTAKQTESKINLLVQKTKAAAPTMVLLDNFEVFAVDPENNEDCRIMEYFANTLTELYENYTKHPIIFIAVTDRSELKPNIMRIFLEKFHLPKLNTEQRYQMLEWFSSAMQLKIDDDDNGTDNKDMNKCHLTAHSKEVLRRVAAKTETFRYGDLDTLMHFALRESYLRQQQIAADPDMQFVKEEHFNAALESIRSLQSQHLDAPKIPKVYWEDIGGLEKLKKELLKTIEFPIKYPHLFKNSSLKRSGILLYGPPGCGKTLVAKAVSTELNVSFMSVKGPELLNMYIGQSEENVRKVFEAARASSPCIVFLDELDALAPRRGSAGDSGGASDRVVSQLLAVLDGVAVDDSDDSSFVFIMGATNRPDLLEQSLLRPGRLDKLIYVGPYSGVHEKTGVLKALCRNHRLRPEVDLSTVARALPPRVTGADLMAVVGAARAAAVRRLVRALHAGTIKESELSPDSVVIGVSELTEGVDAFKPSVTDEELAYYESLRM